MTLLEINNVSKWFGGIVAVREVTFNVDEGEILGLIGTIAPNIQTAIDAGSLGLGTLEAGTIQYKPSTYQAGQAARDGMTVNVNAGVITDMQEFGRVTNEALNEFYASGGSR